MESRGKRRIQKMEKRKKWMMDRRIEQIWKQENFKHDNNHYHYHNYQQQG